MTMPIAFTVIGAILVTAFLCRRVKGCTPFSTMLKAASSFCFILTGFSAVFFTDFDSSNYSYAFLILTGLVMGAFGDIWLDLKYTHPESDEPYTWVGIICFMLGHGAYIVATAVEFYKPGDIKYLLISIATSIPFGPLMYISEDLFKANYGVFKKIIALYSFLVVAIGTFPLSLAIQNGFKLTACNMLLAGAVCFQISDYILNQTYFSVKNRKRPVDIVINHISYYIAQFIIALSLCFVK